MLATSRRDWDKAQFLLLRAIIPSLFAQNYVKGCFFSFQALTHFQQNLARTNTRNRETTRLGNLRKSKRRKNFAFLTLP